LALPRAPDETLRPSLAAVFGGNALWPGMEPYAACYGGHQFGHWAGQLGDGRAITLGEVVVGAPARDRGDHRDNGGQRWDLQLKGAGRTPYSRTADGRAVLRSSLREFVASEAMHHLGVPTTRALSLVSTGDLVIRDMFYDGNPQAEPGAVVCRVAPTFLRFGNYEIFAARDDRDTLRRLVDYTLATHFPGLLAERGGPGPEAYGAFLREVATSTARLMVAWMRVGFTHGVMNTDNMSILGLTVDYGPFGFLDAFDPAFTPNTTDAEHRRYRFGHQAAVARWNVLKLGEALFPLLEKVAPVEAALEAFAETYVEEQAAMLAAKLGWEAIDAADGPLCEELFALLQAAETDYTLFFRGLADAVLAVGGEGEPARLTPAVAAALAPAFYPTTTSGAGSRAPESTGGGLSPGGGAPALPVAPALEARWDAWLTGYFARAAKERRNAAERRAAMNAVNPLYVFRNYLAQEAIDAAEAGDLGLLERLMETLRRPYVVQPGCERFAAPRPDWARQRAGCSMLSCSS
jgi:uncharacterized protein YdiU (UPF0061 family)